MWIGIKKIYGLLNDAVICCDFWRQW